MAEIPNTDQIAALAPDSASAKAGRGLVKPAKWPTLGQSPDMVWGECQGSGSKPYQVSVDLEGLVCKCTCPSRKFPCKHGLGLLFLAVEQPAAVNKTADPPPWAANWLSSRREKAEKKAAAGVAKAAAPVDVEATAKRTAKRLEQMRQGSEELGRWLADQLRYGIAHWPQQPASFFAGIAARMVDAKLQGLATEILRLETLIRSGDGWLPRALGQLGRIHLLVEGLSRFESLPAPMQADLRAWLGWPLKEEEVLAVAPRLTDDWCIVGQVFTERDRLWERRTWLVGRTSAKPALLLDFTHGQRNFALPLAVGMSFQASLAFYPGGWTLRAALGDLPQPLYPLREPCPAYPEFAAMLADRAEALAANPWLLVYPCAIAGVIPVRRGEVWRLRDAAGVELPMQMADQDAWALLAMAGGRPIQIFGEWSDGALQVLSGWAEGFHGFTTT